MPGAQADEGLALNGGQGAGRVFAGQHQVVEGGHEGDGARSRASGHGWSGHSETARGWGKVVQSVPQLAH